jgi:hypothetical protein
MGLYVAGIAMQGMFWLAAVMVKGLFGVVAELIRLVGKMSDNASAPSKDYENRVAERFRATFGPPTVIVQSPKKKNWGFWLVVAAGVAVFAVAYANRHNIGRDKPTTAQLQGRIEHCLEQIQFCEESHDWILSVRDELVSRAHRYDRQKKGGLPAFYRETADSLERYTGPSPALLAGHKTALTRLKDGIQAGTFPPSGHDALDSAERYVQYWHTEFRRAKELIARLDRRTRGYRQGGS